MQGPRKEGELENLEIPKTPPEIVASGSFGDLVRWLKFVPLLDENIKDFRPYYSAKISYVKVPVDSVYPCALYALNSHLRIQKELRAAVLARYGLDTINLPENKSFLRIVWGNEEHFLYPPIIEKSEEDGGIGVITDGLHRFINARSEGDTHITVALAEGVASPLPVLPVSWNEIKFYESTPPLTQKRRQRFPDARSAILWQGENVDRFLKGFPEALLRNFGYSRYFKALQDFRNLPASMLGIGNKSMFKLGETPPLEAIMKYGRDIKGHDELYGLIRHLNFAEAKKEPIPDRLLPLTSESVADLKKEWGIYAGNKLYEIRLRENAFIGKIYVTDPEWWEVWNWNPENVIISHLNVQPDKLIEGWELVIIKYDARSGWEPHSYLMGWIRKREIERLIWEADEIVYSYDPNKDVPKQQLRLPTFAFQLEA